MTRIWSHRSRGLGPAGSDINLQRPAKVAYRNRSPYITGGDISAKALWNVNRRTRLGCLFDIYIRALQRSFQCGCG
ncbi:unnamed protein product, partial [Nezara viridula]